jgi:hypothetical protein
MADIVTTRDDYDDRAASHRAEHLAWCKQRAIAYLDRGDLVNALASFVSDMNKEPATAEYLNSPAIGLLFALDGVGGVQNNDPAQLRRFIEGCN